VVATIPGVQERTDSQAAILDAAYGLFARFGPDGASLRAIGEAAGYTHALVVRHYGTKDGLVDAVAARMAAVVDGGVDRITTTSDQPVAELLHAARTHRASSQLLIRSALGDLPATGFPACLHLGWLQAHANRQGRASMAMPERRRRIAAYAATCVMLGFVTFEGFVVAATGLGALSPKRRDRAVALSVDRMLQVGGSHEPRLESRDLSPLPSVTAADTEDDDRPASGRDALLASAIELFAARGPASVSVRGIAHHANVNQGLIYRHFGSKDALLAVAIEESSSGLFPAALADEGFDFDAVSWMVHHRSPAPRLIARTLVDDVDIRTVRRRFPILRRLIDDFDDVPTGAGPGDLSDPRVAVASAASLVLGSAVWGEAVGPALGLRGGIESAVSDLARLLVAEPLAMQTAPVRGDG
jgi:AcrR family transcriptional regulator